MINEVKKRQKEAFIFKGLSPVIRELFSENSSFSNLFFSRVELSRDGGRCYFLIISILGEEEFNSNLNALKLYAPSLKKSLAALINSRFTPEVRFSYDKMIEKFINVEKAFKKASEKEKTTI